MLRGNKLLIFAGKLIFFLILATALFAFLAPKYNWLVVQASNRLIALLEHPYQRTILKAEGENIRVLFRFLGREEGEVIVPSRVGINYEMYYGLVLLLALFLATPNLRPLRRTKLALIAFGAIFAYHVVDLTITARSIVAFQSEPLILLAFVEPVVPVFLWGLLTFRYWLPLPKAAMKTDLGSSKVGPNDPCPCGSGKKYKYCCGRRSRKR